MGREWPGSQPCPSALEEEAAVAGGPCARRHLPSAADFARVSSQHRHRARWLGRSQRGDSSGLTGATETGLGVAGSWVTVCKAVKDKLENFSGDLSKKELT